MEALSELCEKCGTPLSLSSAAPGCLQCLLSEGFDEAGGRQFQHYEVALAEDGATFCELGRGAMGITYRALDTNLGAEVALKVISARYSRQAEARERFRREARAAAQLRHPNVATVFHYGETSEGHCFYAMELVEGETLEARVQRQGSLGVGAVLEIGAQVARALLAAEKHGLIHRDLKPSNLMLVPNEQDGSSNLAVKVIDFGLAKSTAHAAGERDLSPGGFVGTPTFASPEQLGGAPVDSRSDIYSLGVTLWYALTGEVPCPGKTIEEIRNSQAEIALPVEQLLARKVPPPLIRILRRSLATDPVARPPSARALIAELELCRTALAVAPRRRRVAIVLCSLGAIALGLLAFLIWNREPPALPAGIAVLPFENLSDDKEHAFFADGVQDDILTKLSKIADLKVISRSSVMQYRGKKDVRQIGNALGVSHVLEGTVRRFGGKVHVNAQLVDVRTDADIWAEEYDRDLKDLFAIETEVAQSIANRLRAKVSARELAAIQERPTKDLAAYDFYVRAVPSIAEADSSTNPKAILQTVDLLNQAIARDPDFLLAYYWLARAHDWLYFDGDHTPARLALAQRAIDSAFHLNPNSGEAHLALALHLYWGYFDYARARAEIAIARRTVPNNPEVYELSAWIDRRQGRWSDAVRNVERASELDPRNFYLAANVAAFYFGSRPLSYEQTRKALDRMLALRPNDINTRIDAGGGLEMHWRADTRHWHATIEKILAEEPASANDQAMKLQRFQLALFERDFIAAGRIVAAAPQDQDWLAGFNRDFWIGVVARAKGDAMAAQAAFTAAHAEQEAIVRAQPDVAPTLSMLGMIDAGLRRKEEALREGRRAVELMPIAKDSTDGPGLVSNLAWIYAWTGERDLAIEQLEIVAKIPGGPTYGELRLDPVWDSLRGDPRFEKIVASLAPHDRQFLSQPSP